MTTFNLVSGYEFHKMCRFSFCDRYPLNTDLMQLRENDFIFLNFDTFNRFLAFIRNFPVKLPKFNLLTHNSDRTFRLQHYDLIRPYITKIYCINCDIQNNADIVKIPLGFVDDKYKPHVVLCEVARVPSDKSVFCYLNFAIRTNPPERQSCYNILRGKPWVACEFNIPPKDFYATMKKSRYVISPDGTGYDCHRVYEAILFDTIPIIKRNPLSDFYDMLPVMQVGAWTDLTEEILHSQYDTLYKRLVDWKLANPGWTGAGFWMTQ